MPLALLSIESLLAAATNNWVVVLMGLVFGVSALKLFLAPWTASIKTGERERLRKMYEHLALEKLDVIKTAVAMGYKQSDLIELDARLESVIGSAAMQKLLEAKSLPGSGSGKGKPLVIGINISADSGSKAATDDKTVDLDDLMQSELADGLRQRARQREGD